MFADTECADRPVAAAQLPCFAMLVGMRCGWFVIRTKMMGSPSSYCDIYDTWYTTELSVSPKEKGMAHIPTLFSKPSFIQTTLQQQSQFRTSHHVNSGTRRTDLQEEEEGNNNNMRPAGACWYPAVHQLRCHPTQGKRKKCTGVSCFEKYVTGTQENLGECLAESTQEKRKYEVPA